MKILNKTLSGLNCVLFITFSDTGQFVAPFLRCLGHHNVEIVKIALNNMAEFIVLARGKYIFYVLFYL